MFGIELSKSAAGLVAKVERLYGTRVREERPAGRPAIVHARGYVAPDGTPAIEISDHTLPTEAIVVHELIHLEMYGEGYPDIQFNAAQGGFTQTHLVYLKFLLNHVHDSPVHCMFFPRMRAMGLDPETEVRGGAEAVLRLRDYPDYQGLPADDVRAIYYFKMFMNVSDDSLRRRLADMYLEKGWRAALDIGRRMVAVVATARPATREQMIASLESCLKLLDREGLRFSFRQWRHEMRGRHQHWYAVFEVGR
jgi:hypothetical protein